MSQSLGIRNQSKSARELYLNYAQDKFIFSENKYPCLKGTWGCGKSLAGLLAANKECEEIPNNLYLVMRKEWVDLRDSTLKDWNKDIGRSVVNNEVRYENGSILMFRHGDDLNSLKNINLGGALMVQGEEMTEDDFWFINGRLRRKEGTRQLRIECNYDGHNWIYNLFNIQNIGELITTNTFDNAANLPDDYIPRLQQLPKKLRDRHLYGTDADMEGLVWDEFTEGKHVIAPFDIPIDYERIITLDHGVTNPTAVLWGAVDYDGKVFIYDEYYEKERVISYHAREIKGKTGTQYISRYLIDPSCNAKINNKNGQLYSIIDEYRDNGLNFNPADNAVLAGCNRVNEFFKSGKLVIFKNCVNLIREIINYKWARLKPGVEQNEPDKPVKHNDHACDALRYLIMSRTPSTAKPVRVAPYGSVAWFEEQEELEREDWRMAFPKQVS